MERVAPCDCQQFPGSWSPDAKTVAIVEQHLDTSSDIAMLDTGTRRVTPFLNSPAFEGYPEFSPDGRWLAYASDESKPRREVYVRPVSGPGPRQQVSAGGGVEPLWSRDGKQLFYRWHDQVWVVDVQADNGLKAGTPRLLFERAGYLGGNPFTGPIRHWDLSRDGQRFLMVKLEKRTPAPVTDMILVQNWFEELGRRGPARK
jgi:eukaryotic-like serine/threonine-protein kinase